MRVEVTECTGLDLIFYGQIFVKTDFFCDGDDGGMGSGGYYLIEQVKSRKK